MIVLSASKIATYLQCPRKYRFRYVARVPAPWKSSALALGSAVHAALETFHRQRAAGASMAPVAGRPSSSMTTVQSACASSRASCMPTENPPAPPWFVALRFYQSCLIKFKFIILII